MPAILLSHSRWFHFCQNNNSSIHRFRVTRVVLWAKSRAKSRAAQWETSKLLGTRGNLPQRRNLFIPSIQSLRLKTSRSLQRALWPHNQNKRHSKSPFENTFVLGKRSSSIAPTLYSYCSQWAPAETKTLTSTLSVDVSARCLPQCPSRLWKQELRRRANCWL